MRKLTSLLGLVLVATCSACFPADPCPASKDVSGWVVVDSPREANINPKKDTCGVTTGYVFDIAELPAANVFWKMEYVDNTVKKDTSVVFAADMTDIYGVAVSQRIQIETVSPRTEFGYGVPKAGRASIIPTKAPLDGVVRSFTVLLPASGKYVTEVSNFTY